MGYDGNQGFQMQARKFHSIYAESWCLRKKSSSLQNPQKAQK